jgi:putative inorganic carbon (hco3(-)) transporter
VDHACVTALALVNGPLPKAGVIVLAVLAAGVLLAAPQRARALAMLGLLVLAPVLLLADVWNSPRLHALHHHPLEAALAGLAGLGLIVILAAVIARRRWLVAPLIVLSLPFRIPITLGGTTSNLLVPLYVVLAAATLADIVPVLRGGGESGDATARSASPAATAAMWLERLLAAYVVLYAVQAAYSLDFQLALQQVVFFYAPFALAFSLLSRVEWSPRLVRLCLIVAAGLAIAFTLVAFVEYATRSLFLNPKLIATNADHTYFAANSIFYDSNIFGRFLALAMVLLAVTLLYDRARREQIAGTLVLALLWVGLLVSLSRSSLGALLAGLIALAALRWRLTRAAVAVVAVVAAGAAALAISPHTFGLEQGFNGVFSGRGSLVSGGVDMFGQRPVWGWGSGSFQTEYLRQHPPCSSDHGASGCSPGGVGDSHTLPVTIAAEQGVIGELAYLGLLAAAAVMLAYGARGDPVRAAVAAAFVGLVVHTLVYDDFLSDPAAWALLGIGAALARAPGRQPVAHRSPAGVPAPAGAAT